MTDRLFCPRCGGREIVNDWSNPFAVNYGAPLPRKCRSCGYRSMIFPAEPDEEEPKGRRRPHEEMTQYLVLIALVAAALYLAFR